MDREPPARPSRKGDPASQPQQAPAERVYGAILLGPVSNLHPPVPRCVPRDTPIRAAIHVANNIPAGSVLVTELGRLIGIITERDVLYRVAGQIDLDAPVHTVMTADPATIRTDESIAVALQKMHWGGFRHIPVVDVTGKLTGILSVKDILRLIVSLTPEAAYDKMRKGSADHAYDGIAEIIGFAAVEQAIDYFSTLLRQSTTALIPNKPICVSLGTPMAKAIAVMKEARTGSVLVTDGRNALAGIVTERDVLRKVILRLGLSDPVEAVMTPNPQSVLPQAPISDTLHRMQSGGFRHMPIVDSGGALVGVVSIHDFIRFMVGLLPGKAAVS